METKGAHILITGANRGIGKAVAKRLAEDGACLFLAIRKSEPKLIQELEAAGAKSVEVFECDLSSRRGVDALIEKMGRTKIDILFNNAGLLTGGYLEEQPINDIYEMLQVNVNALIHLTHAILPSMLKRKRGLIINHSSVSAIMNVPGASTYAASKAAVLAFTNCLRQELKDTGVNTLVLITPGIKTRMFDLIGKLYDKMYEVPKDSIPPEKYAEMIREAIVEELEVLSPSGLTGATMQLAKYLPSLFERAVAMRFKR
jgi:short-subunit dehydrogenase